MFEYSKNLQAQSKNLQAQLDRDITFLKMAKNLASLSHCVSHQVGCLFVKNGRVISSGINGTPQGFINCDEVFDKNKFDREAHHLWSRRHEIHAEQNVIDFAARHGIALEGSTVYCTLQPCSECVKNLIPTGIVRVVFEKLYDKGDKLEDISKFYDELSSKISIEHISIPPQKYFHIVVFGDTLSEICEKYKVSFTDVVKWNKITNPDLILPGQVLHLTHNI